MAHSKKGISEMERDTQDRGGHNRAQFGAGVRVIAVAAVAALWPIACSQSASDGSVPSGGSNSTDGGTGGVGTGGVATGGVGTGGVGTGGLSEGGAGGEGGLGEGGGGGGNVDQLILLDAVFADGTYFAVGETTESGRAVVYRSKDATHWSLDYDQVGGASLQSLTASPSGVYAVGGFFDSSVGFNGALVLRSQGGEDWEVLTPPEASYLGQIAWTGTRFFARGDTMDRKPFALTSADGIDWEPRNDLPLAGFAVGESSLLAWGDKDTGESQLLLSEDEGETFDDVTIEPEPPGSFSQGFLGFWPAGGGYGGLSRYRCCFGEMPGSDRYYSLTSIDGRDWSHQVASKDTPVRVVEMNGVAVGVRQDTHLVMRKGSSGDWLPAHDGFFHDVIVSDRFVAVGQNSIISSLDGDTWEEATLEQL